MPMRRDGDAARASAQTHQEARARGRLVILHPAPAEDIGATVGIVLTEPRYSAARNYQIIPPVFTSYGPQIADHDLLVSGRGWLDVFPAAVDQVLPAVPTTHSVWHHDDIPRETEYVVDDDTLAEIDRRLCDCFSLPPGDADG
ncbi:MAG TPA: hypothetical protein VHG93_18905 [Longimicrobium sp.]|nr:hypothetical protein [Longimicrobium sp.]